MATIGRESAFKRKSDDKLTRQSEKRTSHATPPLPPRSQSRRLSTIISKLTNSEKRKGKHQLKKMKLSNSLEAMSSANGSYTSTEIRQIPSVPIKETVAHGRPPPIPPRVKSSVDIREHKPKLNLRQSTRSHVGSGGSQAVKRPRRSSASSRDSVGAGTEDDSPYMFDSSVDAQQLFKTLIRPIELKQFFAKYWEKQPLLLRRHNKEYNQGWFSTKELDHILRENCVNFSEHLDVVAYVNGKKEVRNPHGRAYAAVVWDYYQSGCSVRLMNPQTYSRPVWKFLSVLQEFFSCMVGANVYLTPAGSQGFAPHYDDIEAFILQLEGKKRWRLYPPRNDSERLPRFSSRDFRDEELGPPILDHVLEAGDLLYMPRGIIHQGQTLGDAHSMHITVSCMQRNTWGDLIKQVLPQAIEVAMEEDVTFRESLPLDYLNYMGVAHSDKPCPERQSFLRKLEQKLSSLLTYTPVDSACDQLAKKFLHDSLPPVLTDAEKKCSIHGHGERWDAVHLRVVGTVEVMPDTEVKLVRRGVLRMVAENDDQVVVFHNLENTRVYHEIPPQFIDLPIRSADAVEALIHSYPGYIRVEDLPLDTMHEKIEVASLLYDKGLLISKTPLELAPHNDDDDSWSSEEVASHPLPRSSAV